MLRLILASLACQFLSIHVLVVTSSGAKRSLLLHLQVGIASCGGSELGQLVMLA